ncbi:MAG: NAD-dependent epimerase/dehydratase family protein [Myxococcales bacterium]
MRVVLLGGTRFVGLAILEQLLAYQHEVLIIHRGEHEIEDIAGVRHLHSARSDLPAHAREIAAFRPEAAVDACAMTLADARAALEALPRDIQLVLLSSMDVYRAFGSLWARMETDPLPLTEESPLRERPLPNPGVQLPGWSFSWSDYDKIPVERAYLARDAIVLRLPVVFGEQDYLTREEAVLRRIRAGRKRIPVGAGNLLFTRGYVRDIAEATRLAISSPRPGVVYNVGESRTASFGLWMRQIAAAAGAEVEFVRVPDEALPPDLRLAGTFSQHLLVDSGYAREELGFRPIDPAESLRRSVEWHLANPPEGGQGDFAADDAALRQSG